MQSEILCNPKLRRFIGVAQFYALSIPNLSQKLVPLNSMIRGKKAPRSALKWTADTKKAFVDTKDSLVNFTALAFPAPNAKIKHVSMEETNLQLLCDESILGKLRTLVPDRHRQTIFNNIHYLSPEVESLRTHLQVPGLGLEAQVLDLGLKACKSSKMFCPRLEDSVTF